MKNIVLLFIISGLVMASACKKDEKSEKFVFLTTAVWQSDSLVADGIDASGPGGLLEKFKGEAKFMEDGSGSFGNYSGQWRLSADDKQLTITTDSLPLPITCNIRELTAASLKITATITIPLQPLVPVNIRMTFKAK
jgi:hypothetical protein